MMDGWIDEWMRRKLCNSSKTWSIGKRKQNWTNTENGCYSERKFQSGWNVIETALPTTTPTEAFTPSSP